MTKTNFYYSYKKDAWSWVLIAKDKDLWGLDWKSQVAFIPKELLEKTLRKNKKSAESLVYEHLISHPKKQMRQMVINENLKALEKLWRKIEGEYFKRLEKITQKPIFTNRFKCYITTGFMCPYDKKDKSFMISMWHNLSTSMMIICHEIFHLQFLHYYEKYCRKFLSKKKTEDLKESLTFILNTDFNDLLLNKDNGYPAHQKLRKELKKIWIKDKHFNRFINKAIQIVKKKH